MKVAASILSDLDESVDPCDDFYHFSCGGWIKKNPIPDGQSDWSMFKKLTEANELVIKNALESGKFKPDSAKEKAQRYYNSCIDKKGNVEKLGGKPLLDLMRQKVGAWQLLSKSGVTFEPISNLTIFRNQYVCLIFELCRIYQCIFLCYLHKLYSNFSDILTGCLLFIMSYKPPDFFRGLLVKMIRTQVNTSFKLIKED